MPNEREWRLRDSGDPENVAQLSAELGIDPVLASLLVTRGVHTFEEARSFFRPSLSALHDPFLMLAHLRLHGAFVQMVIA